MKAFRQFLQQPIQDWRVIGLVITIALAVIFAPQVDPTDWELNTKDLVDGLAIYQNPDYVYPPWSLIFFPVYRLMTAVGARMLAVVVIAWLAHHQGWSAGRFLSIIINPLFIFTMLFSNIDLLVYTFAIVLWFACDKWRGNWAWRGVALAILMIKPQGSILLLPYLLWMYRHQVRMLIQSLGIAALITVPISFIGSPPLLFQWFDNIFSPSEQNELFWAANNISMTNLLGLGLSVIVISLTFILLYFAMRFFKKAWTTNHMIATLLLSSMLLSPYTSTQSVIAALAFVPSWIATGLHYLLTVVASGLGIYNQYASLWMLLFGVLALWFMPTANNKQKLPNVE